MPQEVTTTAQLESLCKEWITIWVKRNASRFLLLDPESLKHVGQLSRKFHIKENGEITFGVLELMTKKLEYGVPGKLRELQFRTRLGKYISTVIMSIIQKPYAF